MRVGHGGIGDIEMTSDCSDIAPVVVFLARKRSKASRLRDAIGLRLLSLARRVWDCDSVSMMWDDPQSVDITSKVSVPEAREDGSSERYEWTCLVPATQTTTITVEQ